MITSSINIGDICQVFSHDPECESVGSIPIDNTEDIVWIPKGSHVLITQTLTNLSGNVRWCHAMFDGRHVEISRDLLEVKCDF